MPGTVAAADRAADRLPDMERAEDYDATDWWYRLRFEAAAPAAGEETWLHFDGLATLADVWLNGEAAGTSVNMFRALPINVTSLLRSKNELLVRFRSLRTEVERRRPRARWRTNLVEHQQLRWFRTTLLGRIPGWSPPVRAVGPWQPVRLERRRVLDVVSGDLLPRSDGTRHVVETDLTVRLIGGARVTGATVSVAGTSGRLDIDTREMGHARISGTLAVPGAEAWWPHTHGSQPRYAATLLVDTSEGAVEIDAGSVAFRSIDVDRSHGGFRVLVNGVPVFCRGACWTPLDIVALRATDDALRAALVQARDAHMNMIRIGGTMTYEDSRFFELCDELGILVWQDFMFANMDYPVGDDTWRAEAAAEATAVLAARRRFASLAVCCGGSEVEQQAAMLGLERDAWTSPLYSLILPAACAGAGAGVAYVSNSPTGGTLPFSVGEGVSHYYGVGAYLRPFDDARRAGVRFTTETLGFANVPEPSTIEAFLAPGQSPTHHPRWKARVPRDIGPGWDFDDVRDHYLAQLFGVDPLRLRYSDIERYLALSRVTTGEAMARTFAEWRREGSNCWGGLVWFNRDFWPGAGWGVVDSFGHRKAAWYYLRRAFAPIALFLTDEGLDGLGVQLVNDGPTAVDGDVELTLYRGARIVAQGRSAARLEPRTRATLSGDGLLGRFSDLTHAYRFGPPSHDVAVAEWRDAQGLLLGREFFFPQGPPAGGDGDAVLSGAVTELHDTHAVVEIRSERLAYAVRVDAGRWESLDNYLCVAPGGSTQVLLSGEESQRPAAVELTALNGGRCRITLAAGA